MKEAVVLGYDRSSQSWTTGDSVQPAAEVPPLDGALRFDEAALDAAAEDFGHIHHQRPIAVLEPGSSQDIVNMVNFAREQGIKIGPRGQAMNGSGLSQVEGGIVIKMSTLDAPPVFGEDLVEVSAGMTWRQVLQATLQRGLRPPALAQAAYLSVGGTLSVCGIDGESYRHGAQVDRVLELQVVTGEGKLETCSASHLPQLFDAVVAGLGQCGIILRATSPLIPAQTHARSFELLYPDLPTMLGDEQSLVTDGRFDRAVGFVLPSASGGWIHLLRADRNFTPPGFPDDGAILQGLNHLCGFEQVVSLPYFDCAARGQGHGSGRWLRGHTKLHHPWFSLVLPDSTINQFAAEMFAVLKPSAIEPDFFIEFYRLDTSLSSRPLFRLPDEQGAFLVVVLGICTDPARTSEIVDRNHRLLERARALGGTFIPSSGIRLSRGEWEEHFGPSWPQFVRAKRRFDPDNILSPGPGIF